MGSAGFSNDLRDMAGGRRNKATRARSSRWTFSSTPPAIGSAAYLAQLNGCEALVFTAGIGENNPDLRAAICANLDQLGLELDPAKNAALRGAEGEISSARSAAKIFVIPANEELVVARETRRCIGARN